MMYNDDNYYSDDFFLGIDDFLLSKLLAIENIAKITPDAFEIVRANVRSEIYFSTGLHESILKKVSTYLKQIEKIPDFGLGGLGGGGGMYAGGFENPIGKVGGGGRGFPSGLGLGSSYMGGFFSIDDVLIDKFIPAQVAVKLNSSQLKVLSSLIKMDIITSPESESILRERIAKTLKEL
jgi:hypothetical protein